MVPAIMVGTAIAIITTAGTVAVATGGIITKAGDWAGLDGRPGLDAHQVGARHHSAGEQLTMKVRELVRELQALPDQDAIVVNGEGANPLIWLLVTGIIERRIAFLDENPAFAKPGPRRAYEIV
ncbi:hypothetical protein [Bradyrhizobium japonicum]|uniref:hypothetical protein n=1 Tax=Bradyrhizobium japonicum TaxID=375 RepID=UPI002714FDB4|nr:hypothetical protein [Bradyrhizobium japonicum]WLB24087.1 hypothetical protein QIH95_50070 [Bradyrhizobium japonicum]